jgi:hypothetical protein
MMSSPCANSHASATWPPDAPLYFAPMALSPSASLRMLGKFCALYLCSLILGNCILEWIMRMGMHCTHRSMCLRKSDSSKSSGDFYT